MKSQISNYLKITRFIFAVLPLFILPRFLSNADEYDDLMEFYKLAQNVVNSHTQNQADFSVLKGPYLGQKPPGMIPEIFAPGIVKNCPSFNLDGNELYFRGQKKDGILFMLCKNGEWTVPKIATFSSEKYSDLNPYLSPDGKYLFFTSNREGDFFTYWVNTKIIEDIKQSVLN
ncbi:MAG: PD40 domain-containing protein [bacterium]|nr:MAG: PD40 domain-containing protein [bacterium]